MTDHQCPSCGGFCKKSGCERENAALIGEVKPVAWMCENQNVKDKWYLVWSEPSELGFNRKPLYSAEALATAVANEQLRCAKICESLFDMDDDSCDEAERCAAAIRGMKP